MKFSFMKLPLILLLVTMACAELSDLEKLQKEQKTVLKQLAETKNGWGKWYSRANYGWGFNFGGLPAARCAIKKLEYGFLDNKRELIKIKNEKGLVEIKFNDLLGIDSCSEIEVDEANSFAVTSSDEIRDSLKLNGERLTYIGGEYKDSIKTSFGGIVPSKTLFAKITYYDDDYDTASFPISKKVLNFIKSVPKD